MVEFALILALIIAAHRLRRSARETPRSIRIDIYHHWPSCGPGERRSDDDWLIIEEPAGTNVVPFRRRA